MTLLSKLSELSCFRCIVAYQSNERNDIRMAVTIYKGMALCDVHVNTDRGLPADFDRYPSE